MVELRTLRLNTEPLDFEDFNYPNPEKKNCEICLTYNDVAQVMKDFNVRIEN